MHDTISKRLVVGAVTRCFSALILLCFLALNVSAQSNDRPVGGVLWVILKLAFGIALSIVGMGLCLGTGLGLLSSLLSWKDKKFGSQLKEVLKKAASFAVCAGLVYYFWDRVVFHLKFARLLGQGVAAFGACLFPIFAVFAFILLLYSFRYGGRFWVRYVQAGKKVLSKPLVITLCLPLLLLLLPRSEVAVLRSWTPRTGPLQQVRNDAPGLTGVSPNSYVLDNFGRVVSVQLRGSSVRNLQDLAGIETLTSLERLDLQEVPLGGVLDISALTSLKVLRLRQTGVTALRGLDHLQQLEELEIERVDLDAIEGLERLPELKRLVLTDCSIINLYKIGGLSKLGALYLDGTNITNLAGLSALKNLTELSIAGTRVEDLGAIEHLPIISLNIRDTNITEAKVRSTFDHPLILVSGKIGLQDGLIKVEERFLPPETRTLRNRGFVILGIIFLALWLLPSLPRFKAYPLVLLRRLFAKTVLGAVLVILLISIARLQIPVAVTSDVPLNLRAPLLAWAAVIAVGWLILRPLLVLGLETRRLNASRWSIPADFLVRLMPAIVIFGPVSYKMISNVVTTGDNVASLIFLILLSLISGVPWLIAIAVMCFGIRNWKHKLQSLHDLTNGNSGVIVEVPLRLSLRNIVFDRIKGVRLELGPDPNALSLLVYRRLLMGVSGAMLFGARASCGPRIVASVITIRQKDLSSLKRWEVQLIQQWVEHVYYRSWGPMWLVGDWIETLKADSTVVGRNLNALDALLPYLSGTEHRFKIEGTIFPLDSSESMQQCLVANEIVTREELEAMSLEALLNNAFMPVAVLFRGLFGHSHLADRLDALMRATEISVAFFALALTAEYQAQRERFSAADQQKIDAGLTKAFKTPPDFYGWIALLFTFMKRGKTDLVVAVQDALSEPALPETAALRTILENTAGRGALAGEDHITRRRQTLTLLRQVRNLLTAHGPVIERAAPDLYRLTFLIALDLLASLPWSMVAVCRREDSDFVSYQGLRPVELQSLTAADKNGIFVRLADGTNEQFVEAHRYFHGLKGSVAMYIGEDGFFDPLTGLRV